MTKLHAAGARLLYSTYLGGSGSDGGNGITVDGSGQAYVTGVTGSTNFPTVNPFQATNAGGQDAFVTKISDLVTNQFPVCSAAQANPAALWSPNHQFVPIVVMGVTDPDGDSLTITVTGVTQDEPVTTRARQHESGCGDSGRVQRRCEPNDGQRQRPRLSNFLHGRRRQRRLLHRCGHGRRPP